MNSINSKAFKLAHQIKNLFASWSDAVTAAWRITKMSLGIETKITFAKKDGELRKATAIGTGNLETIKKGFVRFLEMVEGAEQWRSFRIENLIFN